MQGYSNHFSAPSPFIQRVAAEIAPNSEIIDLGAGESRNAVYLAQLGHKLIALEKNYELAKIGHDRARALGDSALKFNVVCGDVENLPITKQFDVALCTQVLQLLGQKEKAYSAIENVMKLTKAGGKNALSAYVGTPSDIAHKSDYAIFAPGELASFYQEKGWQVSYRPHQYEYLGKSYEIDGISATDEIVALNADSFENRVRRATGRDVNYWARSDPDYYETLYQTYA